jgi:hypothetical protein
MSKLYSNAKRSTVRNFSLSLRKDSSQHNMLEKEITNLTNGNVFSNRKSKASLATIGMQGKRFGSIDVN